MKNLVSIAMLTVLVVSCSKKTTCDNATSCVKNVGNDTINYAWNSSSYDSELLPGQSACQNLGAVETEQGEWFSSSTFNNDHGDFGIISVECHEVYEIE